MDTFLSIVFFLVSSNHGTFVEENPWFSGGGGGIVESVKCAQKTTYYLPVRYRVRTGAFGSNHVMKTGVFDNTIIQSPLQ